MENEFSKTNLECLNRLFTLRQLFFLSFLLVSQFLSVTSKDGSDVNRCFESTHYTIGGVDPPDCKFSFRKGSSTIWWCEEGAVHIHNFAVVYINCSASYPLDFNFDGILPTEAIDVELDRVVIPNSDRTIIRYRANVTISSVPYQFNQQCPGKNCLMQTYSRTGKYSFSGYHNLTHVTTSVYVFFQEDEASKGFIRNRETAMDVNDDHIVVPCRPTDKEANVTLFRNDQLVRRVKYDPRHGFNLRNSGQATKEASYRCVMEYMGEVAEINFPRKVDVIDDEPRVNDETFQRPSLAPYHQPSGSYSVGVACSIDGMEEADSMVLNVIGSANPTLHKLRREFVLPAHRGRSYKIMEGKRETDFPYLKLDLPIQELFATAFCGNENQNQSLTYATELNYEILPFKFDEDWSKLTRNKENADRYIVVGHGNVSDAESKDKCCYNNFPVRFHCRLSSLTMVPPAVWFVKYKNGSLEEVHIDYNWEEKIYSYLTLTITSEMDQVLCSASLWFSDDWFEIPFEITHIETVKPHFEEDDETDFRIQHGSKAFLRCRSFGVPVPYVYWVHNGKEISERFPEEAIIEIEEFTEAHAGKYACMAENFSGSNTRVYTMELVEPEVEYDNTVLIAGIAAATIVIVVAIAVTFYFIVLRSRKACLTVSEIAEFLDGTISPLNPELAGYELNYVNIATSMKYDRSLEVGRKRFQKDTTCILGQGVTGLVYKGLLDGRPVAIKTVKERNTDKSHLKTLLSEIKVLHYLGESPFLIQLLGAYTKSLSRGIVYVFVEYCPNGCLEHYLKDRRHFFEKACNYSTIGFASNTETTKTLLTIKDLYSWALQIAQGMAYLSSRKVVHGDLATRNILVSESKTMKITDFGLARQVYEEAQYVHKQGTRLPWRWLSPEAMKNSTFSTKSDVWAYGVTLWEIFTLAELPYAGCTWGNDFIQQVDDGMRLAQPYHASSDLYTKLMDACWEHSPELRPSFETIVQMMQNIMRSM